MIRLVEIESYDDCGGCGELKELSISIQGCYADIDLCEECFNQLESKINLK